MSFIVLSKEAFEFGVTDSSGEPNTQTGEIIRLQTPENGEIAVTHLPPSGTVSDSETHAQRLNEGSDGGRNPAHPHGTPIIMLHGMFSNRKFWVSDKRVGIAAHLSDLGYDCWMIERRGMGYSGKTDYKTANLMQCIEHDLPAVQQFVFSENKQPAFWLSHSFGGVFTASSLAQGFLDQSQIRGVMNFSSQLTVGKHMINFPGSLLTRAMVKWYGYFPSKKLNMGPENEAPETMLDTIRLVRWAKTSKANNYWNGFDTIRVPALGFGSEGDTIDPHAGCKRLINEMGSEDKRFILLGKAHGHRQDYTHAGMVVSKDAIAEVWPMVDQWLAEH